MDLFRAQCQRLMMSRIPVANPRAQYVAHQTEIDMAIRDVLGSGRYVLGDNVTSFEQEFSCYLGVQHTVGVNSGTDALTIGLRVVGVESGEEVIVPSLTASPTVAAIVAAGGVPRFADILPGSYTVDPSHVRRLITRKTRAVVAVHLYGCPAELDALRALCDEFSLALVEDCAQSCGASFHGRATGSIGDIGCFSFFPTKNLGAIGDGGAITTNNPRLAELAVHRRQYGWDNQRSCITDGVNSRLDEIQAAILRVKLRHLNTDNNLRCEHAMNYHRRLKELAVVLPAVPEGARHSYHLFVLQVDSRDSVAKCLAERGVEAAVHYRLPTHKMPAFSRFGTSSLPVTEAFVERTLSVPMYPELSNSQVELVCDALHDCIASS